MEYNSGLRCELTARRHSDRFGGSDSAHPSALAPSVRVTLAVASQDDVGAALVDTNGDDVDIDLDGYLRDAHGVWRRSSSVASAGGRWSPR